jgi:hypothetical protein
VKQIHHKYLAYLAHHPDIPHINDKVWNFVGFYLPEFKVNKLSLKYGTRCYTILWFKNNAILKFRIVKIKKANKYAIDIPPELHKYKNLLEIVGKATE